MLPSKGNQVFLREDVLRIATFFHEKIGFLRFRGFVSSDISNLVLASLGLHLFFPRASFRLIERSEKKFEWRSSLIVFPGNQKTVFFVDFFGEIMRTFDPDFLHASSSNCTIEVRFLYDCAHWFQRLSDWLGNFKTQESVQF